MPDKAPKGGATNEVFPTAIPGGEDWALNAAATPEDIGRGQNPKSVESAPTK
ncbi:hypothetical protein GTO89_06885 [Heliobacterium gestii]|uniref:Uncharacterized protein n=1 Tax=Heliomicrobium gestii TaxID=2699 RepID=A0A845LE88_HELGE|nr:hypothetical protein [Heliomicrobium gestii]MBM7866451.1 hypothetical protein [Heliomicrobium gestii]MZP42765.1 hypothetical protein [Heliomicrobium gestii]